MPFDSILRGGRVIDPSQKLDAVTDVAFAGGKVAMVGKELKADPGTDVRDVSGYIVTPGLIDLHTHVYWGGTSLGIDAEEFCRTSGVTTAVDTGSAGPGNFAGFRKHVIEPSQVRILAYLHISHAGIFGFSHRIMVGESEEIRLMNPIDAVTVAEQNRDLIVGIKVRVGLHSSGTSGIVPLEIALEVAEQVGMPLMAHIDHPPPSYEDVLARLRPGDVLTHAFRPFPNTAATAQGHGETGGAGGARTRRIVRHRPRQGLVRLQDRTRNARQRLLSGHHLFRRPCAVHRRPSLRSGDHHVKVPVHGDAAAGRGRGVDS
jgi:dihydroorotase